ncbi:MAG: nucleotidyltransferase family protein [Sphingomonadales bacterium]
MAELKALCIQHHVVRLSLFGSAARDDFDPATSDLDFLVEFAEMRPGELSRAYFDLADALQRLFGRKVDLVTEGTLRNPYRRASILADKQPLYDAA